MAWTAPRTWTVGEVVTAAIMNTHVRDNQLAIDAMFGIATAPATGRVPVGDATDFQTHAHLFVSSGSLLVRQEVGGLEFDASAITTGGILYGSGAGTFAILVAGTDGNTLQQASGVPAWQTAMSQAQAEAGTDTQVRPVSALRVAQAIAALESGGAPATVNYLVGTADAGLSAEIVVGTSPNGELGGTWGSITVDATHAGGTHPTEATQANIEAEDTGFLVVPPDLVKHSPGVLKVRCHTTSESGTLGPGSYNVTSNTRDSAGNYTVTIATDFGDANIDGVATPGQGNRYVYVDTKLVGAIDVHALNVSGNTADDSPFNLMVGGDQ